MKRIVVIQIGIKFYIRLIKYVHVEFTSIFFGGKKMSFLKDESGQGAAEYILLFGGVIVIAVAALVIYRTYFSSTTTLNAANDVQSVRGSVK
jgi:hypothetical protein